MVLGLHRSITIMLQSATAYIKVIYPTLLILAANMWKYNATDLIISTGKDLILINIHEGILGISH